MDNNLAFESNHPVTKVTMNRLCVSVTGKYSLNPSQIIYVSSLADIKAPDTVKVL